MVNVIGKIKLHIEVGKASPSPPVGPALGQKGINIMAFCKDFNDYSSKHFKQGTVLSVNITVYEDKSYKYKVSIPSTSSMAKKVIGLAKGSTSPSSINVGYISIRQVYEMAVIKLGYSKDNFTQNDVASMCKSILGTVRSMGVKVVR